MRRLAATVIGGCLFAAGLAAGCGSHKPEPGDTVMVTVHGRTMTAIYLTSITRATSLTATR